MVNALDEVLAPLPWVGRKPRERINEMLDLLPSSSFEVLFDSEEHQPGYDQQGNPYFAYQVLFKDGKRFRARERTSESGDLVVEWVVRELPRWHDALLPSRVSDLRKRFRRQEHEDLMRKREEQRETVSAQLQSTIQRYELREQIVGLLHPPYGFRREYDPAKFCNAVFVPAETSSEAIHTLQAYGTEVGNLFAPLKIGVSYLFRPITDGRYAPLLY